MWLSPLCEMDVVGGSIPGRWGLEWMGRMTLELWWDRSEGQLLQTSSMASVVKMKW